MPPDEFTLEQHSSHCTLVPLHIHWASSQSISTWGRNEAWPQKASFPKEEAEDQRGEGTCYGSQSKLVMSPGHCILFPKPLCLVSGGSTHIPVHPWRGPEQGQVLPEFPPPEHSSQSLPYRLPVPGWGWVSGWVVSLAFQRSLMGCALSAGHATSASRCSKLPSSTKSGWPRQNEKKPSEVG